MTSRQSFSPLCDLHHGSMRRVMVEGDSEEVRSYHACERRDCTRIFRDLDGYTDLLEGDFDDARASQRVCPRCGAILYLAEVDRSQKIETWECTRGECNFSEDVTSPSAR
jgi:hypothetical protein